MRQLTEPSLWRRPGNVDKQICQTSEFSQSVNTISQNPFSDGYDVGGNDGSSSGGDKSDKTSHFIAEDAALLLTCCVMGRGPCAH